MVRNIIRSLPVQVTLTVALIIVMTLSGLGFVISHEVWTRIFEQERQAFQSNTGSVSNIILLQVEKTRTIVSAYADNDAFRQAINGGPVAQSIRLLNGARAMSRYFEDVILVDAQGRVLASAGLRNIGDSVTNQEYFRQGMSSAEPHVDEYPFVSPAGSPAIGVSAPIMQDGKVIGLIAGIFNLERFSIDYIINLRPTERGFVFVTDDQGVVLMHPERDMILKNVSSYSGLGEAVTAGLAEGFVRFVDETEFAKYASFQRMEGLPWYVVIADYEDDLLGILRNIRNLVLLVGGIAVVLLVGLMVAMMRYFFLNPIRELNQQIVRFEKSMVAMDPPKRERNELDELEKRFALMSAAIVESTGKIQDINTQLTSSNTRMKNDLEMARAIQAAVLPNSLPETGNIRISAAYTPMEDLGGDFYDVYRIGHSRVGILVIDASGHGVPAALVTMMAKVAFATNSLPGRSSAAIMEEANKSLCTALEDLDNYLTAFYAIIDLATGTLEYTNAGHNDVYLIGPGETCLPLTSSAPFLGKFPELRFHEDSLHLEAGQRLVMYTDGIPELRNPAGEFYGEDRFKDFLIRTRSLGRQTVLDDLERDLTEFRSGAPAGDDITLVMVDVLSDVWLESAPELMAETAGSDGSDGAEGLSQKERARKVQESLKWSMSQFEKGKYEEAASGFAGIHALTVRKADTVRALYMEGICRFKLKQFAESKTAFERALEIDPGNEKILNNLRILQSGQSG